MVMQNHLTCSFDLHDNTGNFEFRKFGRSLAKKPIVCNILSNKFEIMELLFENVNKFLFKKSLIRFAPRGSPEQPCQRKGHVRRFAKLIVVNAVHKF